MRQLVQQEVLLVAGAGSCGSHKKKSCAKPPKPRCDPKPKCHPKPKCNPKPDCGDDDDTPTDPVVIL